jgi:hypothetical protein
MQDDSSLLVLESRVDAGGNSIVRYLAEIETPNTSESRAFYLALDGEGGGDPNQLITLVRNYSALEYTCTSKPNHAISSPGYRESACLGRDTSLN